MVAICTGPPEMEAKRPNRPESSREHREHPHSMVQAVFVGIPKKSTNLFFLREDCPDVDQYVHYAHADLRHG